MSPRLCRDRLHIDQIELSIAARQFHALAVMSLGLFEIGEWPRNRNNGVRAFDVGPCGDGGVPLPVKPTANMKDRIGPNHPCRFEFRFRHCLYTLDREERRSRSTASRNEENDRRTRGPPS